MKERVGNSARDGDGEGATNDVHAASIMLGLYVMPPPSRVWAKGLLYQEPSLWGYFS